MESVNPPKAFVLHVGTNNLDKRKQSPEQILPMYQKFVETLRSKFPESKLVFSMVAPREDSHKLQLNVDFLNAALHRNLGDDKKNILFLSNSNLRGQRMKKRDGIHLKEEGTRCLARKIRDGVMSILNIQ